jgi:hypothetical protein
LGAEFEMYEESHSIFEDFEIDKEDVPKYLTYTTYRALSCYYVGKYNEAAKWINGMLNDVSLRKFPTAVLEVKSLLALQYCCMRDYDLFNQLVNSIQRQIRLMGKDECEDVVLFIKMLKTALSAAKREKAIKVRALISRFKDTKPQRLFSPLRYVKLDDRFVDQVVGKE